MRLLTSTEIQHFKQRGYVVVQNLVGDSIIPNLGIWIDELVRLPLVQGAQMVYLEEDRPDKDKRISRIEKFAEVHDNSFDIDKSVYILSRSGELSLFEHFLGNLKGDRASHTQEIRENSLTIYRLVYTIKLDRQVCIQKMHPCFLPRNLNPTFPFWRYSDDCAIRSRTLWKHL